MFIVTPNLHRQITLNINVLLETEHAAQMLLHYCVYKLFYTNDLPDMSLYVCVFSYQKVMSPFV